PRAGGPPPPAPKHTSVGVRRSSSRGSDHATCTPNPPCPASSPHYETSPPNVTCRRTWPFAPTTTPSPGWPTPNYSATKSKPERNIANQLPTFVVVQSQVRRPCLSTSTISRPSTTTTATRLATNS